MTPHPDSLRIARTFAAPPARLYRAWTDAAEMARWYSPGEEMTLTIDALDVRVGGRYQATFGRSGEVPFVESGEYREVVPDRRLVFDMSLARGSDVFSRTRCTVEFVDRDGRTQLILTDEGDGAGDDATGWGPALDHLAQTLGGHRRVTGPEFRGTAVGSTRSGARETRRQRSPTPRNRVEAGAP